MKYLLQPKDLPIFESLKDINLDDYKLEPLEPAEPWNKGLPKEEQPFYNKKHSEKTKKKISNTKKGIATRFGPHSEKTKKNISIAKSGKPNPHKGKTGLWGGWTQSEKQKEAARKNGLANKGKKRGPRSEETKRKIAESQRKRHALKRYK